MSIILGGDTPFASVRPGFLINKTFLNSIKKPGLQKHTGFYISGGFHIEGLQKKRKPTSIYNHLRERLSD